MKSATVTSFPLVSQLALEPLNQLGSGPLQNLCPHKGLVAIGVLKVRTFPDLVEAIRGDCRFCRRAIVDHLCPSWHCPEGQYEHDAKAERSTDFSVEESDDNKSSPYEDFGCLSDIERARKSQNEQHC